jgi:hypothetical protein|tara:strand:- start:938 stop:1057 length:120 start_codon:yes stop_codon:yes gene_type:complete
MILEYLLKLTEDELDDYFSYGDKTLKVDSRRKLKPASWS